MKKFPYIIILAFIGSISIAKGTILLQNDTSINQTDINNLKQGYWKIFGRMKTLPDYQLDQVIEEGKYENSRKQGLWKKFFPNSKLNSEITYTNSRPNGRYRVYYNNGSLEEEGVWKNNRNIKDFTRYHPNGQVSQKFNFSETGKREGKQEYLYENGQVMITGNWDGGKEAGTITEYYENGDIKAKKIFNGGKMDAEKSEIYESKTPVENQADKELKEAPVLVVKVAQDEKTNDAETNFFTGEGDHRLYNKNKQISKDGFFKGYRLMEGKWYIYDDNGILVEIKIIKKGRHIGNAPLPKE